MRTNTNTNSMAITKARSTVGRGMRLGSITLKSPKDYDRQREKQNLNKMIKEAIK